MAVTADTVQVRLEAETARYVRNIQNAERTSTSAFGKMATSARAMNASVNGALSGLAGAFVGVQAVSGAVKLIDAATGITNALKVAGLEGEELTRVYDKLYESAQKNATPVESMTQLYSRLSVVQKELGVSSDEILGLTDTVGKALRVAGTDATAASGALLQLSQAMGSGIVRAEEFNSVLEGATPLLQAAAAGLEEAGGSVSKLRQLVVDGKLSSEAFFRAIEAGSYVLDERLAGAESTVSQSFVRLQNVLVDTAMKFNEGTQASKLLSDGIDNLSFIIGSMGAFVNQAIGPLTQLVNLIGEGTNAANGFANELARLSGLEGVGYNLSKMVNGLGISGLSASSSAGGRVLEQSFSLIGATPQDEALARYFAGETPPDLDPLTVVVESDKPTISINDYAVPTTPGKGKGGASAVERERQGILDLIETMEFERSLIGLTAREKEIENAARRAGSAATAEQIAYIRELAAATYDENEAIRQLQITSEEWANTIQDATRGFIDDLIEGKTAAEAFGNVLSNIGSKLLDMGLSNLFGSSGFNLGGLFGGGFPTRAMGGNVYAGQPTMINERGQEIFVPTQPGRMVPASQVGGGASVTFAPQIDARGADVAAVARLEQSLQRMAQEMVPTIRREIANGPKKGRR